MGCYFDDKRKRWNISIHVTGPNGRTRRTKMLPAGTTEDEARALHDKMDVDLRVRKPLTVEVGGWGEYVESLCNDKKSWIYVTLAKAKTRTKEKGWSTSLTLSDVKDLLIRSKGRCEVTGIPFQVKKDGKSRPFFHSIDRIDSSVGYRPHNLRLVCYAVNVAMMHWGEDVLEQVATGYIVNKYCAIGLSAKMKV